MDEHTMAGPLPASDRSASAAGGGVRDHELGAA